MPPKDQNFLARLRATFKAEAQEHIQAIANGLVALEKAATAESRANILDATFRSAHSLKGASRTVNETDMESLCQQLESVFAAFKRGEITQTAELFDLLHKVVDALGKLLLSLDEAKGSRSAPAFTELISAMQSALAREEIPKPAEPVKETPKAAPQTAKTVETRGGVRSETAGTVRVSTSKLDAVLLQAEELLAAKLAMTQHASKLRQLRSQPSEWRKKWSKFRPEMRLMQQSLEGEKEGETNPAANPQLARLMEFLEWNRDFVESLETELLGLSTLAEHDQRSTGVMVDNLLDEMKKVVMQPFSTLLDIFPRFMREISRELGKEVELLVRGGEIEIDRRILEEMKDPLIHLARNCMDHGIEEPAVRTQKGKPEQGTITISVSPRNGSNVELVVMDDGAGIDVRKVKTVAVKQGFLTAAQAGALGAKESLMLICQTGVSTSPIITDISGRGLGLAIVKEKTDKLNGTLSIETDPGKGTLFRIVLPLTLSRFRGVVVRAGEHLFVLPTSSVARVVRVKKGDVKTVEGRETIVLGDEAISLVRLAEVLDLPRNNGEKDAAEVMPAVLLASANRRIAFIVDAVLLEQEVLVKTLPKQLGRVRNIAGATVLGTGEVVPILNVTELMQAAVEASETVRRGPPAAEEAAETRKKSVLIAEDSITARTLLKNILTTAGYEVETAVDGVDAFTKLRSSEFDLVVSDVDMPRMNGFGLTTKIRADKKYAELPVVLVTALESREDREHGIDAGANAYIVKSSFDQSNLLEVIRRLI